MSENRQILSADTQQRAAIVTRALVRAADKLGLTSGQLAKCLGVSSATIARLRQGRYTLSQDRKEYELAVLLLRLFRSADAILGGDEQSLRSWMATTNTILGAKPADLVATIAGLTDIVRYVDARRAPI